jgi:hypothetical protein
MVTRHVEPAAFATGSSIEFCTVADLIDFVTGGVQAAGVETPEASKMAELLLSLHRLSAGN